MEVTLASMVRGQEGTVRSIDGDASLTSRLLEMGLTPGQPIQFVGTALLGDPIEIQIRGYRLSLRKADAACIRIELASTSSD